MKQNWKGPFFLAMAAVLWSTAGVVIKSVVWDPISVAALRGTVSFFALLIIVRPFPMKLNKVKLITAACYFGQGVLYIMANKYTTAANATMLQYTSTLYIILFTAIATKKLPKKLDVAACIVLLGGVALAFAGTMEGGGMLGNIMALLSALFYAGVFYCSRMEGADAVDSMVLGNAIYMLLLPFLFTNPTVMASPLKDWGLMLVYGLMGGTGAWLCFAKGIRTTPSLQANFITMLEPVLAPIWTFVFLRETITIWSLLGAVVVIGGILVYNTLQEKLNAKEAAAKEPA